MHLEVCAVRKTHLTVLAIVLAVAVLAVGAVGAYAGLADDATPPVTTTDAVADYWDAATVVATATDAEGIAYSYHELDNGVVRLAKIDGKPTTASITIPTDKDTPLAVGDHTLLYWAQDANGNVEAQQSLTFTIKADTVAPTTSATAASVVRGRTATLKYKVNDAEPTKGTAKATIKIKNSRGKVVKTINVASVAVNVQLAVKFRCTFAKGTYKFFVTATDASGNEQSKIGSAKLTVK